MTIENRFTLYNINGYAKYRRISNAPLVLTLEAQGTFDSVAYFDYGSFKNIDNVLLEVDKNHSTAPSLFLQWGGANPGFVFASLYDNTDLIHVGGNDSPRQFDFPLPDNLRYAEYVLRQSSPPYRLKVTVKRKS